MKTLHEKIIEFNFIGFDVKFEQFNYSAGYRSVGTYACLRYNGIGGTKIENRRLIITEKFNDEQFVISVLEDVYKEMKPHAIGHSTLQLEEND